MFRALVDAIEKFVTDFSGRRLAIWFGVVALVVGVAAGYEWYTNQFRLARMSDQVTMLERLQELRQRNAMDEDSTLVTIYERIRADLKSSVERPPLMPGLPPRWVQALIALAPWVVLALLFVGVPTFRPDDGVGQLLAGMLMIAVPFAAVGALLPPSWPELITRFLYPVGGSIVIFVVAAARGGSS